MLLEPDFFLVHSLVQLLLVSCPSFSSCSSPLIIGLLAGKLIIIKLPVLLEALVFTVL